MNVRDGSAGPGLAPAPGTLAKSAGSETVMGPGVMAGREEMAGHEETALRADRTKRLRALEIIIVGSAAMAPGPSERLLLSTSAIELARVDVAGMASADA